MRIQFASLVGGFCRPNANSHNESYVRYIVGKIILLLHSPSVGKFRVKYGDTVSIEGLHFVL